VGSNSVNSIQVTLDALPSSSLTLTLGTKDTKDTTNKFTPLVPPSVDFTNAVQTKGFAFSVPATSSVTAGVLEVIAVLSGPSSNEYLPVFVLNNTFTVLVLNVAPPVPGKIIFTYIYIALVFILMIVIMM
jgi:hypothetical protein